ncbi:MAG: DNA polymerase II [Thermoplasmata archaeon]|nr:DNA polymerase II [Thermoplasmata archaeon]
MGEWNVRLLAASYSRKDDVVLELFGRTDTGKSVTVLYKGFKPYFFLVEPPSGVLAGLKSDDIVLDVEEVELFHKGVMRRCAKVTIRYPWMVPDYRKKYGPPTVLAADIPFHHRFIYDMDLGSCFKVTGSKVGGWGYTTDLVVEASEFGTIEAFKPDLKILSFDIENSIATREIYTICYSIASGDENNVTNYGLEGSEKDMIRDFVEVIKKEDPDVITGYNIDGYDIPLLLERAEAHKVKVDIGRNKAYLREVGGRFWRLNGRIIADAWWNAKLELRPKQETLNAVAKLVLGEEKHDVNPIKIDEEWAADKDKVIKYCKKDAELALKILLHIAVLEKGMDLGTVAKLPLDDVVNGRTSTLIDSILIREADKNKIGVPLTAGHKKTGKIEGGYVHTINPGLYDWVCVLDFKSMYPSLIIAKNICFTTLSPDGTIKSPEPGVSYLDKDTKEGLLPQVLERLMAERDDIKAKQKAAEDENEKKYYDGLQFAIKILMNAFYGVFASAFYRFTNPKIGASITAFARENTKSIIDQLESEDLTVVYGDTDSVFFQSPGTTIEEALKVGKSVAKRYSKEGAVLEFEGIYNPLFSHGAKKRYVGRVVWPEEKTIIRGYETRRSDSFNLQSDALTRIFDMILDNDIDSAVRLARDLVSDTMKGEAPVKDLVISRTCKEFRAYKEPDSQTTVQTAKKIMEMGYEFVPGMKVSWVVVNGKKSPIEAEPYIDGKEFTHEPDYYYYARRMAMTLARITDVFGWDMNSLMSGSQQKTLFSDGFGDGGGGDPAQKKESVKIKKTDKKLTLDDFL